MFNIDLNYLAKIKKLFKPTSSFRKIKNKTNSTILIYRFV